MNIRTPQEVKAFIQDFSRSAVSHELTRGQMGAVTGEMNRLFGDRLRRRVLGWLFNPNGEGELSAKLLTNPQWLALREWCGFFEEDGVWQASFDFQVEYGVVVDYLLRQDYAKLRVKS